MDRASNTKCCGSDSPTVSPNSIQHNGLSKEETLKLRNAHLGAATTLYFKEDPLKIIKGFKQHLFDENGNQYLDCINNVAHVGHCHPAVTEAACKQLNQLYTNCRYLNDNLSTYVYRLAQLFPSPLDTCFLTNSGSESNDLALQLAKAYTGGTEVITLDGAYHGHLQSCLEISPFKWRDGQQSPDYVHVVPTPDTYRGKHASAENPTHAYAAEVKCAANNIKKQKRKLAAFIMESLQSCGGQIIPPQGYMAEAFSYAREAGGLCIADEVQVGFGRIGTHYWAFEPQGAIPDIVTIGKPMGNGHPVSAVITTKAIADCYWRIANGYFNTYGGNPVSCAIAHAVLDVIEGENLMKHAVSVGDCLIEGFEKLKQKYSCIGDVRGLGLFIGVEIVKDRNLKLAGKDKALEIYRRMKERFIIISVEGPDDNVIKIKPPMCFSMDDAARLLQTFDEILSMMPEQNVEVVSKNNKTPAKILTVMGNLTSAGGSTSVASADDAV